MSIDKDNLLVYFQQHYLSRQEVLFKLPLNISIDTFWPELLNRRKAAANILPLYNSSGLPYWYVLTNKMIAASERLCTEAMGQEEGFDPYRAPMTSAMTEEMFFTSFVEGAQIPLQEAMDFLQRGTEPENIQEQMIWNNRHAWTEMIGSLYRPLDESFVKSLAFMLTEEMDGCAEDYRQTDEHPIAAMNGEPYEVPSAFSLPDRMTEYYSFLQRGDIHPLIKAAVGQAYILVARPFPEGNERLSRMISSAVLLRSGYDFFRDISISGAIAKESYRYYKCMQEIIRGENGGDLTYFIEYFVDLLTRTLDMKKEREQRRAQDMIKRERELARMPLQNGGQQTQMGLIEDQSEWENEASVSNKPWPLQPVENFMEQVRKIKQQSNAKPRDFPKKIERMIENGLTRFTVSQWRTIQNIGYREADYECRTLYNKGLMDRHPEVSPMEYSFRIISSSDEPKCESEVEAQYIEANESPPEISGELEEKLKHWEESYSLLLKRTAKAIRSLIGQGIMFFGRKEWGEYTGFNPKWVKASCDRMIAKGIIVNSTPNKLHAVYMINRGEKTNSVQETGWLENHLGIMASEKTNERDQRIGSFLLEMIREGKEEFYAQDWGQRFNQNKTMYGADIRRAINLGLVRRGPLEYKGNEPRYPYSICYDYQGGVRSNDLTEMQKEYLSELYNKYSRSAFSTGDMAKVLKTSDSAAYFHLDNFTQRGILRKYKRPGKSNLYIFAVTSKDHPECFTQIKGPIEADNNVEREGELAMAIAAGKDLTASA